MAEKFQILLTQEELQKLVNGILNGATIGQAVNVSKDTLENLYALAYNLYSSGNYKDGQVVFQALCLYDPNEYKFWMGLAGCRQALKLYRTAIDAYQMAAVATTLKNPEPFLYAARCLLELNMKEEAIAAIQALLTMGDAKDPKVAACHEKGKAILALLQKKA